MASNLSNCFGFDDIITFCISCCFAFGFGVQNRKKHKLIVNWRSFCFIMEGKLWINKNIPNSMLYLNENKFSTRRQIKMSTEAFFLLWSECVVKTTWFPYRLPLTPCLCLNLFCVSVKMVGFMGPRHKYTYKVWIVPFNKIKYRLGKRIERIFRKYYCSISKLLTTQFICFVLVGWPAL